MLEFEAGVVDSVGVRWEMENGGVTVTRKYY